MTYKPLFKHTYNDVTYYICQDANNDAYLTAYTYNAPYPYPQALLEHVLTNGMLCYMIPHDHGNRIVEHKVPDEVMKIIKEYCGKFNA